MTATFILWVLIGTAPAQERGTFGDYQRCVEAGYGEAESLRAIEPDIRWQCLPASNDRELKRQ